MARFLKTNLKIKLLSFLFFAIFIFSVSAEIISDQDFNFSMDLPEGYEVSSYSPDGMSYIFTHANAPVSLVLKIKDKQNDKDSKSVLSENLTKLGANSQIDTFTWSNKNCAVGTFKMKLDKEYEGWALSSPLSVENSFITLICYAPVEEKGKWEQFIISSLNSLCIDQKFYSVPGIITSYAYPSEGSKIINLNINGKKVQTKIDKSDVEASKFLVNLEFAVLTLYQNHDLKIKAWQRFYRMIYRDSFGRLENVSSDIFDIIYSDANVSNDVIYSDANVSNPALDYAQTLLTWVQNFSYKRAAQKYDSDFTSLPAVLTGEGNDCDSRSMLICVLLKAAGIECIFQFSPVYAHALASAELNAPGQYFEIEGSNRKFLVGETTAKVTWGMISQDMADRKNWIPVILP